MRYAAVPAGLFMTVRSINTLLGSKEVFCVRLIRLAAARRVPHLRKIKVIENHTHMRATSHARYALLETAKLSAPDLMYSLRHGYGWHVRPSTTKLAI